MTVGISYSSTQQREHQRLTCFIVGPRPGPPRNVSVAELSNGFLISWMPPLERSHLVKFYTINFKTDGPWKTLNKGQIRPEDTSYLSKFYTKKNIVIFLTE